MAFDHIRFPLQIFIHLCLIGFVISLQGCSATSHVTTSKLQFHFPTTNQTTMAEKKSYASSVSAMTLGFDWSRVCYMVNISAPDIPTSKAATCDIPLGLFQGSVPPGGTLALDVPAGTGRSVDVLVYLRNAASDSCPSLDTKSGFTTLSRTRFVRVGQTAPVDMTKASVEVEVEVSTPADGVNLVTQYGLPSSCKPVTVPQGGATSRITSGHTLISGNVGSQTIIISGSISGLQSEQRLTGNGITINLSRRAD